nr:protein FAR1-RELATED SEQUENCE 5-like [Lolium perenne]
MSCREKRKMLAKGDANTTIGIMEKRKRDDPEFYFDYKLGKGGKLLHLFWCDSQSRQDYADFGDVLVFDSTYKTNRYAMPFIPFVGINNHRQTTVFACAIVSDEKEVTYKWLLETFLKAMYQQKPKGIITDGDAAMIAAVGKVFPGVWYRVCTWHIEKNMKKHIDSLAHNEFRLLLYYTTSEQVFEERWRAFVEKHQTELTKEWMKRMYRRKKLWSAAYLANGYFLGMKSNQRSESLNSTLHTHLDFGLTMVDMVVHYENNDEPWLDVLAGVVQGIDFLVRRLPLGSGASSSSHRICAAAQISTSSSRAAVRHRTSAAAQISTSSSRSRNRSRSHNRSRNLSRGRPRSRSLSALQTSSSRG